MPEQQPQQQPRDARSQLEALRRNAEQANEREIDSLLVEIRKTRDEVTSNLARLSHLSNELRSRARRMPETAGSHVIFANAHLRFASAATQGMTRTAAMDRVLDRAKAEQEEAKRQEEREKQWEAARETRKKIEALTVPTDDGFDELYGEVVSHAE